jgi:hypothetical protein
MKFTFVLVDAPTCSPILGVAAYNSEGTRIGQIIAEYAKLVPWTTPVNPRVFEAEDRRTQ